MIINCINEYVFLDKSKKMKFINFFLLGLSLFVVCYIAAVRDITVGTDVKGYLSRLAYLVANTSGFMNYMHYADSELFFSILVYIGYITKNINILFFVVELAVALPIYIYSYLERKNTPFTVNIFIFLVTMYCQSLSMMRQSIAISICILSYYFIDKNKIKTAVSLLIIAVLFHKSAIIFSIVFIINKIFNKNLKYKGIIVMLVILLMLIISFFLDQIISISDYSQYLGNTAYMRTFSINSIIKKVLFVIMWMICIGVKKEEKYHNNILMGFIYSIIALFSTIASFFIPGMGRMGYYFTDLSNFLVVKEFPKVFKQKIIVSFGLLVLFAFLWWNMTAVEDDTSAVYPYRSDIVEFLN